jgi:3-oxoacyl-[acyl-carrier protein] reductase
MAGQRRAGGRAMMGGMYDDLQDKVALITGSSRGIGAAMATAFARAGSRVVLHGRDPQALAAVRVRIEESGAPVLTVTGDVTLSGDVDRMRDEIHDAYGRVDVLVANAGSSTSRPMPIEEIDEADWRADVERNLTATFLTVKSFLPEMKRRGSGSIITVSSAAGRRPSGHTLVAYGSAKAGVQLFTQDLAAQVGPFGIRANCLAPETILTETNEAWITGERRQQLIDAHPIRRLGTPDDVANAALFLASERSGWISGIILDIAGGATLA